MRLERMQFKAYLVFLTLWGIVVYAPVAHWVWGGGWLGRLGALDFAGGTVVHINAGVAAAVAALVLGARKDYARQAILPHNVPFTLLGAGLLWFGWFGFNGGSALAANATVGALLTGILAQKAWNGVADGVLFGNPAQLAIQALAVLAVIAYSAGGTGPPQTRRPLHPAEGRGSGRGAAGAGRQPARGGSVHNRGGGPRAF